MIFTTRIACLLAATLALTACRKETDVDRGMREGIFIVGNSNEPKSLDPQQVSGVLESNILRTLFEGLVSGDAQKDGQMNPAAARSLESDATATVWTAHLRPEGKWSDGEPLTAHDFAFAYERILSPKFAAKYADMLYFLKGAEDFNKEKTTDFSTVGVEVLDDYTLRLTLRGPTPYFPQVLQHYTWAPVPRHAVLKAGKIDQIGTNWTKPKGGVMVCNGPYRLKSWRVNDHLEVERNPYYWDAANVKLNGVRFLPVSNSYTEARMFRAGQMHATYALPPEMVELFKANKPEALHQEPYVGTLFYRCNTTRKPLNDPRVRRALSLAIDQQAIIDSVLPGYTQAYAVTPPMAGYQPPQGLRFNPEEAAKLMAEAGFAGGKGFPRLKILLASKETASTMAQAIQSMWRNHLGIEVEIENKEWTAYLAAMQSLDYDFAASGWIGDYLDPLTFLEMWMPGNGNNMTGWDNPQFASLIQASFKETDATQRLRTLEAAEKILVDEVPMLPIAWYSRNYLMDPRVKGWHPLLLDNHPYQTLSFER
jgi:oligopeptide transport system substrate-binding protein